MKATNNENKRKILLMTNSGVTPNTFYYLLQWRHVVIFHANKHTSKSQTAYQYLATQLLWTHVALCTTCLTWPPRSTRNTSRHRNKSTPEYNCIVRTSRSALEGKATDFKGRLHGQTSTRREPHNSEARVARTVEVSQVYVRCCRETGSQLGKPRGRIVQDLSRLQSW